MPTSERRPIFIKTLSFDIRKVYHLVRKKQTFCTEDRNYIAS